MDWFQEAETLGKEYIELEEKKRKGEITYRDLIYKFKGKIVFRVRIERLLEGGWKAWVKAIESFDGLTTYVFVSENENYRIRKVIGGVYEKAGNGEIETDYFIIVNRDYQTLKRDIIRVLEELLIEREKIRKSEGDEEDFYLLI